jgi:hypothetical protein
MKTKVNLRAVITTLDDKTPVKVKDTGEDLTLGDVSVTALMGGDVDKLDAKKKVARYELAMRIFKQAEVELEAEEIALLKDLIGKAYGVLIVGKAYKLL